VTDDREMSPAAPLPMPRALSASAVNRPPTGDLILLGVAVAAISTSAPLIAATATPALAIAFWRCLIGSGATLPWALIRHRSEFRRLTRTEVRGMTLAGVLLALHFATWITSLRYTSVASSTALVAAQPIWAAVFARWRGAYVDRRVWIGIGVALSGVIVLTGIDFSMEPRALIGDALAIVGGIFSAAYVTSAERVRQSVSNPVFSSMVYAVSAAALLIICIVFGTQMWGYGHDGWLTIFALTAGAQLLGHTLINRVLRTTSATVSSMAILLEMPGAVLVAAVWLGQVPPVEIVPAVVLLFAGLALVISAGDSRTMVESPPV